MEVQAIRQRSIKGQAWGEVRETLDWIRCHFLWSTYKYPTAMYLHKISVLGRRQTCSMFVYLVQMDSTVGCLHRTHEKRIRGEVMTLQCSLLSENRHSEITPTLWIRTHHLAKAKPRWPSKGQFLPRTRMMADSYKETKRIFHERGFSVKVVSTLLSFGRQVLYVFFQTHQTYHSKRLGCDWGVKLLRGMHEALSMSPAWKAKVKSKESCELWVSSRYPVGSSILPNPAACWWILKRGNLCMWGE